MWEKELWIAKRISVETNDMGIDIEKFAKPIRYSFNYQPISGDMSYREYGERISDVYRAFISKMQYQGKIRVGDRAYISDGEYLEEDLEELVNSDDEYCKKANYIVNVVLPQNFLIRVDFLKTNNRRKQ